MQTVDYVQQRTGEFFVGETRVTLHSIIADWKRGRAPEQIVADFPSLPLASVYGAVAWYLERRPELDAHFREVDAEAAREQAALETAYPAFFTDICARIANVRPSVRAELRERGDAIELAAGPEGFDGPEAPTA